MNRIVFIISLIIAVTVGYLLLSNEISGRGLIIILTVSGLISLRRIHLKLKPWWGSPLQDIPKYFKEP